MPERSSVNEELSATCSSLIGSCSLAAPGLASNSPGSRRETPPALAFCGVPRRSAVFHGVPWRSVAFRGRKPSEGGREGGRGSVAPAPANADFMLRGSTSVWSRFKTDQANECSALVASGAVSASTLAPPMGCGSEPDAFWSASVNKCCWEGGREGWAFQVPRVLSCEVNLGRDESGGPGGGESIRARDFCTGSTCVVEKKREKDHKCVRRRLAPVRHLDSAFRPYPGTSGTSAPPR